MASNKFDLKKIQELIKSGEISVNSVFVCEQHGEMSVLQFAIMNSDEKLIDLLFKNNVNLKTPLKFWERHST